MSKNTSGTGKGKPAKPTKRDYRLQILFDQEERAMFEDLAADRRTSPPASWSVISSWQEEMEGRGLTKGNLGQQNAPRTQSPIKGVPSDRSSSLGTLSAPSE